MICTITNCWGQNTASDAVTVPELDCTQSLSFLLIERLERARCATARDWSEQDKRPRGEWGRGREKKGLFFRPSSSFSARLCLSLAPVSQLLWTRKERNCVQCPSRLFVADQLTNWVSYIGVAAPFSYLCDSYSFHSDVSSFGVQWAAVLLPIFRTSFHGQSLGSDVDQH